MAAGRRRPARAGRRRRACPPTRTPEAAARALATPPRYARWRARRRRAAGASTTSTPTPRPRSSPRRSPRRRRGCRPTGGGAARRLRNRAGRARASRRTPPPGVASRRRARWGGRAQGVAPGLVHKAQAGGVALGLLRPTAARRAAHEIAAAVRAAGHRRSGFLVQRMAPAASRCWSACSPTSASARSSPAARAAARGEVLGDVQVRLAPLRPRAPHGHDPRPALVALLELSRRAARRHRRARGHPRAHCVAAG